MKTFFWIVSWSLSILAITGNGFIIFLVCSKRQLRTKTNAFIVSLAVADLSIGSMAVPTWFICESVNGCDNSSARNIEWAVRTFFAFVSVMNLCSLVLDRYIAVVNPLNYLTFMRRRKVILMIFIAWIIPFALIAVSTLNNFLFKNLLLFKILTYLFLIFESLPSLMLTFFFVSMVKVVIKHYRAASLLAKQLRYNHRVFFKNQEKSAIIMMGIVIGLFLVCYGIYFRCSVIHLFKIQPSCNDIDYKIPILVMNSAINPLAYSFFKRDINREVKRCLCCIMLTKSRAVHPVDQKSFSLVVLKSQCGR